MVSKLLDLLCFAVKKESKFSIVKENVLYQRIFTHSRRFSTKNLIKKIFDSQREFSTKYFIKEIFHKKFDQENFP